MMKIKYQKFNKRGFSLVEVLVATMIFVVIITSTLNIFKIVVESQRGAIATQNVEESLKYFLEVTGKEIRMAKRNTDGLCNLPSTDIYKVSSTSDKLEFLNYHDECVAYFLETTPEGVTRFAISRDGKKDYITPNKINVSNLFFSLHPETTNDQPAITMGLTAYALGKDTAKSEMKIQTTLSSRYYRKD